MYPFCEDRTVTRRYWARLYHFPLLPSLLDRRCKIWLSSSVVFFPTSLFFLDWDKMRATPFTDKLCISFFFEGFE